MRILLIDDNASDVLLTQKMLRESSLSNDIDVLNNGLEVLAFLRREGQYKTVVRPDLIVLDLNLPGKGGLEILAEIRADDALKVIPIVILTTSQAEHDIVESYNLYANAYVNKPVSLEQFIAVIRSIEGFWGEVAKLPPNEKE